MTIIRPTMREKTIIRQIASGKFLMIGKGQS